MTKSILDNLKTNNIFPSTKGVKTVGKLNVEGTIEVFLGLASATAESLFIPVAAPDDVAEVVAGHLVEADQCYAASYGIIRTLQYMLEMSFRTYKPEARPEIMRYDDN